MPENLNNLPISNISDQENNEVLETAIDLSSPEQKNKLKVFFASLKNFFSENKKILLIFFGALIFLAVVGIGLYIFLFQKQGVLLSPISDANSFGNLKDLEKGDVAASKINGVLYPKDKAEQFINKKPMAVVINNHKQARPSYGLSEADIIYEAVAEGGITRFMTVFQSHEPEKVGSVRSARVYYLDFASEYHPWFAHWGGAYTSPNDPPNTTNPEADAYAYMRKHSIPNLDQMWIGADAYWREPLNRATEHTGFTSIKKLYEIATKYWPGGWDVYKDFGSWKFKDDELEDQRPQSASISFDFWQNFTRSDFTVKWEYDPVKNIYLRFQGGEAQMDGNNNQQLAARNVIVQFMKEKSANDRKNHLFYEALSRGKAKILRDGKMIEASWERLDLQDRTRFYDETGREIEFNRGQIWVEVVPEGNSVTYN